MNKKIAVIAYTVFSTDSRVQKEAKAAADLGYALDIYTLKEKKGSNYNTYNFIKSNLKQYKGHSKSKYIFSYLKFFFFCFTQISMKTFSTKYQIIHVHNMPNFLVFSTILPKIFGSKIILDIHDLMPEIFSVKFQLDLSHLLIKSLYFEERISAKFADEIIATNSFHIDRFKRNGLVNKRITEVINIADDQVFYPPNRNGFNDQELILAYPSTLAKRLGIDNLLEAMEILYKKNLNIKLNIYGDGEYREHIIAILEKKGLQNVVKLSETFISLESLSIELDKAHIGIIPLPSNVSNDIAMPVKIYEFFAKKICVVASDLPLLKSCFGDSIIFFKAGDSENLATQIETLYYDRDLLKEYSTCGYKKFTSQPWIYYKSKYQSILTND